MSSDIIGVYNMYLEDYPITTPMAVGWTDQETQRKRFKTLFGIGIEDNSSLLDYGCGLGHLNDYIANNNHNNIDYTGIDINHKYIVYANQLYPTKKFICSDIDKINEKFDYVIGSGVFTWFVGMDEVIRKIEMAYNMCNKGVAFNFLDERSGLSPLNLYNPENMVNRLSHIAIPKLVQGYLENEDFTIYLKK
jgi:ubiquinone/menaquinone biosynthesis C-methylase UbiE